MPRLIGPVAKEAPVGLIVQPERPIDLLVGAVQGLQLARTPFRGIPQAGVLNDQRRVIFEQRKEIMSSDDVSDQIADFREEVVEMLVTRHIPEKQCWSCSPSKT